jgi:hypothetical protein
MLRALFALLPCLLFSQMPLEEQSMLHQADVLSKRFNLEIAKAPPPSPQPQTKNCLNTASVFFDIDLAEIKGLPFETLNSEGLWDLLRELGVEGVRLKGLKTGGAYRTAIGVDPKWGANWADLSITIQKKGISLIGEAIGNSTGMSPDFYLALKNVGDYPALYHLIEIQQHDWKLLPKISSTTPFVNVPWLTLQELHKKGYVPEEFSPFTKTSSWNTTAQIKCSDGKVRRWIYLKERTQDPVINWLEPSFAGCRIAAADALDSIFNLGWKLVFLNPFLSQNAKETLSLWARKMGSYSVQETQGGLEELKTITADLATDTLTRSALLHALLAEDAEALKLMYRLYFEEEIQTKRLVHILQPFDEFACDYGELLLHPKKRFQYYEEILTGEALRMRLLKEDIARIGKVRPQTWPTYCMAAHGLKTFDKHREDVTDTHLLLAFFYAMQPGAFSFSVSDLLGTLGQQSVDLMSPNENTLYASLPGQMTNTKSFAVQLKKILQVRRDSNIANGELIAIPMTNQKGLMILGHKLPNGMQQLLAVNFGKTNAMQTLEIPEIRNTTAIDLMTGLAEKKPLESSILELRLPPLTGKVLLFQTKYY